VVGCNWRRFDYSFLQPYTTLSLQALPTVDLLDHLYRKLGFRVSLAAVAAATLNAGKLGDGIQAVNWFRRGEIDKVEAYCRRDVEVTRDVYEFGQRNGYVNFRDRNYRLKRVPVHW
jgi:DEAD/DEAH box helicase domain-containing protein